MSSLAEQSWGGGGSSIRMKSRYHPRHQTYEISARIESFQDGSLSGLSSLHVGPLKGLPQCPHDLAAGSPQRE